MANTFTQIYIQVVFAVEWRQALIRPENKEELHKYITGIVRNKGQKMIAINSRPDHQDEHHAKRSFRDEYTQLLREFDVAFDDKYVFDFAEEGALRGVES